MSRVRYAREGNIALIVLNNPPINALSLSVREEIANCLERAATDPTVAAIVLIGSGRAFSSGADIREMGKPEAIVEPNLPTLIHSLEACPKLVVAAIGGVCMGGGFELAMGADYRIAEPAARLALPEVKLGLLPGAGGTQRLPRAVGLQRSLDFILAGEPVCPQEFLGTPLIDRIADGDLSAEAVEFARHLAADKAPARRLRDLDVIGLDHEAVLDAARNRFAALAVHYPAQSLIIDCHEAAVSRPFNQALRFERQCFLKLRETPTHRALRHAFVAERDCWKIPDVPADTQMRSIDRVAVVGAGTMGRGIAMSFLNAGLPVTLLDRDQEALDGGTAAIRQLYEGSMKRGRLTRQQIDERLGLLTATLDEDRLGTADLIIEAVFEDMAVKEEVFRPLDRIAKPGAILATNTSTLDVNRIAAFTARPPDVIGMHFFSPANVMKLLEVVRGDKTSVEVLAATMKLAKAIGKTAVVAGVCDGFIGNRMLEHYVRMAHLMVENGATPAQVDQALERWGMVMGPFRMGDLAGNDIGWAIRKRRYVERPEVRYARVADRICEHGRFGQKTGKGWYKYEPGDRTPIVDLEAERIIAEYRKDNAIVPRHFDDDEIVELCIYALVNEGARILEDGIAMRASDIDVVYLTGYGFPRFRGGPMCYADEVGLLSIAQRMSAFEAESGDTFWKPAAIINRLIDEGGNFTR